ncbi:altered inheritance of mitochondria protein 32-like [Rhododendron vialii]|uniref:altered inheritance of mitochondria protein 32-like n=1 Tax=Rhododendron vialii TaxID=182163 RepID=UPI00265DA37C|nr:altered inheritance of mitochondria protein 32-like [Rhododendron vialii]
MRTAHPSRFLTLAHSRFSLSSSHIRFLSSSHSLPATPLSPPLSLSSPLSSMAEAVDNTITNSLSSSSAAADDVEFGFKRPEMYKEKLAGTVDPPFDRHVFLCYGSYDSWPSRVESSDSDPLPKLLSGALKTRKNEIGVKTRLTVCEGREGTEFSDGDVLIFPEMIKYRGLKDSDVDSFVEDVIVSGKPWASGVPEVLAGSHVFVCAHANRDKRCGVCGPVLIEKFEEEIETRGLKDQVFVSACSHIGGHKYAGNIIIFSPDAEGKIAGHWYGYVTPDDVPEMLDQHIGKGEIIDRLWRGQMGVYVEPAEKAKEQKIPNGKDEEKSKKKHKGEKKVQVENGVVASCCQGANGVSCCQDGSSEAKETAEVKGKKELGKCSGWMGKWEQSEVLTAVGVVGAVATIAVAYSFYRRSG